MHWRKYLLCLFYFTKNSYCDLILAERPNVNNLHDSIIWCNQLKKLARSLRLIQLTETRLTQRKKRWWPEVASYGERSWVSTKVLSKRLILFNVYHKKTMRSWAYGFILDGFKLVCPLLCGWPRRLSSGGQVKLFQGIF